jgi:hypothetical protein
MHYAWLERAFLDFISALLRSLHDGGQIPLIVPHIPFSSFLTFDAVGSDQVQFESFFRYSAPTLFTYPERSIFDPAERFTQ